MTYALPDPSFQSEFYADVPLKRALAWIVDVIFVGLITALIVPFTVFTALFFLPLLFLAVDFFYRWITLSSRSATLGMRLMSIEFRNSRGERFDTALALLHTLGFLFSMSTFLVQLVSVVLMLTSARRQGLTDHILGTVAINRAALA